MPAPAPQSPLRWCDLSQATAVERVHGGRAFDVYRADWCGSRIAFKTPSVSFAFQAPRSGFENHDEFVPATGDSLFEKRWVDGSEIYTVETTQGFRQCWAENSPKDNLDLAWRLLEAEAHIIQRTASAWNHEVLGMGEWEGTSPATGERRPPPALVMPWHDALPLASLTLHDQRKVFPQMLPALWEALSTHPHGDLSAGNLLLDRGGNLFRIIDPGVALEFVSPGWEESRIFVTTPASYPVIPPFLQKSADGQGLAEFVESSGLDFRPAEKLPAPGQPAACDVLALGILYVRMLSGQDLFMIGRGGFEQHQMDDPAQLWPLWKWRLRSSVRFPQPDNWNHLPGMATQELSSEQLRKKLDTLPLQPREKDLAHALLNLEIRSGSDLLERVKAV